MASKNTTSSSEKQTVQRSNGDSARWISGLMLFFAGLYITASVLFYFISWSSDLSILQGVGIENPRFDNSVENLCGYSGAWLGEWIAGRGFGVFGILLPVMLMLVGVRVIRQKPLLFNHSILTLFILLILGSLTLGFAFGDNWSFCTSSGWGGALGIEVAQLLSSNIGAVGMIILLLGGWILTGVFINRNFINTVNTAGNAMVDQGGKIVDIVKQTVASHVTQNETEPQATVVAPESEVIQEDDTVEPLNINVEESPFIEMTSNGDAPIEIARAGKPEVVRPAPGRVVIGEDGMVELDLSETGEVTMPELVDSIAETAEPLIIPEDGMLEMTLDEPIVCPENMQQNAAKEGVVVTVEEHKAKLVDVNAITQEAYDPMKDLVNYRKPPVSLLEDYVSDTEVTDEEIYENKSRIEETLKNFGIAIQRIKATVGPTVTLYEIVQAQGVKISKIQGLENDIAQSLKALGIRIIAPIPGRGTIGIEVPNRDKQVVSMHSSIRSMKFQESKAELPVVIGRTIQNVNYVFDLTKMPHLLVAGATGQGKSVGLNAIITSLLYTKHPSQLKFVMIDPKMVEFSLYAKIEKHFLAKMESEDEAIITDPKKAVYALHSLCIEMDNRLELCKKAGVRNIAEYNEKFISRHLNPQHGHRFLPYIVVVVDEFSDLIMTAREVESPVMRLAQKARAIGIHLIIATQRPDVKVITGGIKANFPARIAFRVMQMIDSRTIIDQPGANQLIGRGDMLFSKDGELTRIQCALVETKEVERVVDYISKQQGYTEAYKLPDYTPESSNEQQLGSESGAPLKYDALFAEIARTAVAGGNLSTSMIQRNYEVGFNRAGRIMMQLERAGIVGRQEGAKPRDILYHDSLSLEAKLQDLGVF
ncbi:MAG: DNA translocase FtsK 4TM domain-containing protein [Alistipes sp.]